MVVGGGDHHRRAGKVGLLEARRDVLDAAGGLLGGESFAQLGGNDGDFRAAAGEQPGLARGDGAAADDEATRALEAPEDRQEIHGFGGGSGRVSVRPPS
jgi:hypothetical protein